MEIITYDLLLNTRYSGCRQQIQLYKGEVNARRFRIELCHGTEPIVLDPLTCIAIIRGVKADKTVLFNTATVTEKGKVEYTLGSQDTAAVGETWYEVQIISKDDSDTKGRLLYSAQFKVAVNNTAVDDGKITSSSEFGLLTDTIEKNKQWLSDTNRYIVNLEKNLKANIENWEETANGNLNNTIKEGLWLTKVSLDEENKLTPAWNRGSIDVYTHLEVENPGLFLSDYLKGGTNIRFYKFDLGLGTSGNATNFVIHMYDEEKSYIGKKSFSNNPPIDESTGYYEEPFVNDEGKIVSCAYIRLQVGKLYDENYDINSRLKISSVKYSREDIYLKNIVSEMMDKMHNHANKEILDEIKIATSSDVWQGTDALVPMYLLEAMLGGSEIMQHLAQATNQEYGVIRLAGGVETAEGVQNLAATPYELKYLLTEMGLWSDEQMSDESKGIVQNRVIKKYIDEKVDDCVPMSMTLAGISLDGDISADKLLTALGRNATSSAGQYFWILLKNCASTYEVYSLLYLTKDNENTKNLIKEMISIGKYSKKADWELIRNIEITEELGAIEITKDDADNAFTYDDIMVIANGIKGTNGANWWVSVKTTANTSSSGLVQAGNANAMSSSTARMIQTKIERMFGLNRYEYESSHKNTGTYVSTVNKGTLTTNFNLEESTKINYVRIHFSTNNVISAGTVLVYGRKRR